MSSKILIPVLAAALLAGCGKKEQVPATAHAGEAPPVRAAALRVGTQQFTAIISITGTLVSPAMVTVKAETTGQVLKFAKEEGDRVAAEESVVWVDDSHEKIALRQVETAIQVAEASLERAKVGESHSRAEYIRAQNLLKSGGITDRDLKAAELAERDSRAQAALASAQLDQARSQLDQAKKMVADSVVRAPIAGEIQSKMVTVGAYVEPPTAVFAVVDNSRLELEAMVPTADLGTIAQGQRVMFTVNAFPAQKFEGRVIEVNPAVQADTRSAKVRIRVDNSARKLKAGMFAQGEILTGIEREAILIPGAAVYRDDRSSKNSYVFAVENGKAARRAVQIGRERDSTLEILEGLKPGDVIIAGQSIELAEGVRVQPEIVAANQAGK
ncbi:MAG TPA: efflux RND transporter periplasmic adaptor subunit [Bryobacteraceae bacterium]|nr:efflux RND transporter periplasmic adaptor subunit [Bryobacteraceae bacterium]